MCAPLSAAATAQVIRASGAKSRSARAAPQPRVARTRLWPGGHLPPPHPPFTMRGRGGPQAPSHAAQTAHRTKPDAESGADVPRVTRSGCGVALHGGTLETTPRPTAAQATRRAKSAAPREDHACAHLACSDHACADHVHRLPVIWCPRSDSNRHALRRRILNPLRLPFRHSGHLMRGLAAWKGGVNVTLWGAKRGVRHHGLPERQAPIVRAGARGLPFAPCSCSNGA